MARFRLQKVLDHRRRHEDEMRQRVALAVAARARAEDALRRMQESEDAQRGDMLRLLSAGRVNAAHVHAMGLLLETAERAIRAQAEDITQRATFEQEERARLTAAMVERKALDRLRERHEERERADRVRQDNHLMEEIASRRAGAAVRARGHVEGGPNRSAR